MTHTAKWTVVVWVLVACLSGCGSGEGEAQVEAWDGAVWAEVPPLTPRTRDLAVTVEYPVRASAPSAVDYFLTPTATPKGPGWQSHADFDFVKSRHVVRDISYELRFRKPEAHNIVDDRFILQGAAWPNNVAATLCPGPDGTTGELVKGANHSEVCVTPWLSMDVYDDKGTHLFTRSEPTPRPPGPWAMPIPRGQYLDLKMGEQWLRVVLHVRGTVLVQVGDVGAVVSETMRCRQCHK